jgi:sialic acid synthase SpsE
MVIAIRNVSEAIDGTGLKEPSAVEIKNMVAARRSLFARTNISVGEKMLKEKLVAQRPGLGISPMDWSQVVGKKAKREIQKGEILKAEDFE